MTTKKKKPVPKKAQSADKDAALPGFDNIVLVRVRVKVPTPTKKDENLTDKLCKDLKAQGVRVNKDLFKLTDVVKHATRARRILREQCVPWSAQRTDADGLKKQDFVWASRGKEIQRLASELQDCREKFMEAANQMADNYDDLIAERKKALGGAFNPSDYASKEAFRERFEWDTEITPLADVADAENDLRLKLPKEIAEQQVGRFRRDLNRRVENVVADITHRIAEQTLGTSSEEGLIKRLEKYDPDPNDKRKGNTYRDVKLYDNIDQLRDFVKQIHEGIPVESLGDIVDRLDHFCDNVRPVDPQEVRSDEKIRRKVIKGLEGLMKPEEMPEADPTKITKGDGSGFDQF